MKYLTTVPGVYTDVDYRAIVYDMYMMETWEYVGLDLLLYIISIEIFENNLRAVRTWKIIFLTG